MKIVIWVETDMVGSQVQREYDIPDEDLEGMNDDERAAYLHDYAMEEIWDLFEWGWRKS